MSQLLAFVNLSRAVICLDCRRVSDSRHHHCEVCGSTAIWNLAKFLNGPAQPEIDRVVERVLRTPAGVEAKALAKGRP